MLICVCGGLLGVLTGYGLSEAVSASTGWETAITPASVALSVGISVLVGLVFGIVPARRAAGLDPIQALRTDA